MTIVLSAPRRTIARRHTALFVLADLTRQTTMKSMIGIEDSLYGGRVARPAADSTQTYHFLKMHIARVFPPISVAEVTGISAGSHGYSKLVASLPRSMVWEYLVENLEPVPRTES